MESVKKERRFLRKQVDVICEKINSLEKHLKLNEPIEKFELVTLLKNLEDTFSRLTSVDDNLRETLFAESLEDVIYEEYQEMQSYRDKYFYFQCKCEHMLKKFHGDIENSEGGSCEKIKRKFKLPKIQLGKFDGKETGTYSKKIPNCLFCDKSHLSQDCIKAQSFSLDQKIECVIQKRGCFACLKQNHAIKNCKTFVKCLICSKRHYTIMCPDLITKRNDSEKKENKKVESALSIADPPSNSKIDTVLASHNTHLILLQTIIVRVVNEGKEKIVRALIDSGSQRSYISSHFAKQMSLKMSGQQKIIKGVSGGYLSPPTIRISYNVVIKNMNSTPRWERIVRMVKELLRRNLGKATVTYEELNTLLCDCEAIINARPLTYFSEDDVLMPLRPSMFMMDLKTNELPEFDDINRNSLIRRHRYIQKLRDDFKSRFRKEYLANLTNTGRRRQGSLTVGDIVYVGADNVKRIDWPLARIVEIYSGKDGKPRVAKVKTKNGEMNRSFQRLFPLEIGIQETKELESSNQKGNKTEEEATEGKNTEEKMSSKCSTRVGRSVKKPQRLGFD